MTGTDLLQIGSALGAGIAGTLIAVVKYYETKRPPANGNGLTLKDYQAGVDRIVAAIQLAAKDMREEHSENMQQLAGNVAKDVELIVLRLKP